MKKELSNNKNLIVNIIISFILTELLLLSFQINNNTILALIITVVLSYCINKYKSNKKEKRDSVIIGIFSSIISVVFVLQNKINFTGNVHSNYYENSFSDFVFIDILRFFILGIIIFLIINNLYYLFKNDNYSVIDKNNTLSKKEQRIFWIKASILFFIPFFVYLIIKYPGFVLADSVKSIMEGINRIPLTNHHPVLYSELVGFILHVGYFFRSYNFGVFLYSLFQLTIMSMILGYLLLWLRNHNIKFIYIIFVYLFYIANTLFANYAISLLKDPLFSCFILLLTLYLYDIVKNNGDLLKSNYGIAKFVIYVLLIAFFRNNGIYIIIGLFVVMLLVFKKTLLKFHITYLITIVAILLIQGPLYNKLGIVSPAVESFAVPIQQVARTIAYDGNISEENKDFINNIFPIEKWKEKYEPMSVDPIKWDEDFQKDFFSDNKIKFIKVWAEILPSNLETYIKSYLLETYGFWSIGEQVEYGLTGNGIVPNELYIHHINLLNNIFGVSIEEYVPKPYFIGSGTLLWLTVLSGVILILIKKYKYVITLLPCLFSILTILIATPVAFSLRYVFMVALSLPFIIIIPFMEKDVKKV